MIKLKRKSKLTGAGRILVLALLLVSCSHRSNTDSAPPSKVEDQQTTPQLGGADPSGGEGGRSSPAEVHATVDQALSDLRPLFQRMQMFFESADQTDREVLKDIEFLRPVFNDELFVKLDSVVEGFRKNPNYVKGDCPAKNKHDSTDMSVSPDLKLCVSEKLQRYPVRELRRQALSLLAHQMAHALGFESEALAGNLQYWVTEGHGIAFLPESLAATMGGRVDTLSQVWQLFSSRLGEGGPQVDQQRVCEYMVQVRLDFEDLHLIYSGTEADTPMRVPQTSVGRTSQALLDRLDLMVTNECVLRRLEPPKLADAAQALLEVAGDLEKLRQAFNFYVRGSKVQNAFPATPRAQSLLTTLVAQHDQMLQTEKPVRIDCQAQNAQETLESQADTSFMKTFEFTLGESQPRLSIHQLRLNDQGGVGLFVKFFDFKTGSRLTVLANGADITRDEGLGTDLTSFFKVMGYDKEFKLRVQIDSHSPVEITCLATTD